MDVKKEYYDWKTSVVLLTDSPYYVLDLKSLRKGYKSKL